MHAPEHWKQRSALLRLAAEYLYRHGIADAAAAVDDARREIEARPSPARGAVSADPPEIANALNADLTRIAGERDKARARVEQLEAELAARTDSASWRAVNEARDAALARVEQLEAELARLRSLTTGDPSSVYHEHEQLRIRVEQLEAELRDSHEAYASLHRRWMTECPGPDVPGTCD